MSELPRGTVTFLFTDIEGSTALVRKLGERYADILRDQRRLLRAAFAKHEGHEIDTQGDGFFVAFERARDAVLTGAAIQRSVNAHEWPWESAPRVRIGLHTTEPHVWQEGYVGVGIHRAQRICSVGHGGQVLLSRSTAGLAADEELDGISLLDLGEHRLKGMDHRERIFQLVVEGLENDFPPLGTIEGAGLSTETVTLLFADMEGLSRHMRELPLGEFRALLADYHRTLDLVLSETGGTGIVPAGDAAGAAYRSVKQAVLAAAELQRTVATHRWPGGARVRVAVALDSGEVIATGHGHFGEAVNRSVDLVDQARGGEILVGEATKSLLEGEDLGDLELVELQTRALARGGQPLRAYELIVPDRPSTVSAARDTREKPGGAAVDEAVNLDERRGSRRRESS